MFDALANLQVASAAPSITKLAVVDAYDMNRDDD